jgi:GntR family transcriptional regulator
LARHYELYVELYNDLREGTYLAGDSLPSEPDLMRRFRVSRSTVRRALKRLEDEGKIDRRHGSGTYATGSGDADRAQLSLSNLMESLRDLERTGTLQWIDFDTVPTPARVLKLAPEFGPTSLYIGRTLLSGGQHVAHLSAYIRPKWSTQLTKKLIGNRSVPVALGDLGATFSILQQFYGAVVADQRLAKHLNAAKGTALLQVTSLFRESSGHVSHFEDWLLRPDLLSLHSIIEIR